MKNPMTLEQAIEKHQCSSCASGIYCLEDCFLSSTCSMKCQRCDGSVFFSGDLEDSPDRFTCPHCGRNQENLWRV